MRDKCKEFGVTFRPWQVSAGQLILAKRADGKYAATIGGTGMSIPRQVGKTFLVGAIVFALCLLNPKLTVIWTAHRARTAEETFGKMQAFAKRKKIAPFIERVWLGSGEEEIRFRNGSRILFGARAREFGRGFDEVDVLIFDEAQILADAVLEDMIPATNQSRQPTGALLLFMGTPPRPKDPGEVFTRMRTEALSGEDEDTAWVEFGADEGYKPTPPPAPLVAVDWQQVAKANPSYPMDTPREAILRMRKKLGPESFLREGMGIWDKLDLTLRTIPKALWDNLEAEFLPPDGSAPVALAIDRWHDGTTAVAGAWRDDGPVHVEILSLDVTPDTSEIVEWVAGKAGRRTPVLIASDSPAASMAAELKARRVKVFLLAQGEFARACQSFVTSAADGPGRLTHSGQEQVEDALAGATKLKFGKAGLWVWDRTAPENDISSLVAATLAHHGALVTKRPTSSGGRSSNGRRTAVIL